MKLSPEFSALANAHAASGFSMLDATAYAADGIQPAGATLRAGEFALANDSRFSESNFNVPLTAYAVGWRDPANIEAELEMVAPRVLVPRYFTYAQYSNTEEFLSETTDDLRSVGADFKRVEYTSTKVTAKTENRGLTLRVDLDEVADKPNWEQQAVQKILRRLRRNSLRRALALLAAAAVNTAKTWDTTAGKDPDQDVLSDLITGQNLSGVRNTRVLYGDTAWSKRVLAHRAQATAGGFASAGMTPEQVASWLGVEQAMVSRARYQSSSTAKAEILGGLVLSYTAMAGADTEDASHIKRFVTPTGSGGDVAVHSEQCGAKTWDVTVWYYELTKVTFATGIRKLTIS